MTTETRMSEQEFQAAAQHLDELVQMFETVPYPDVQERVFDLLQTIDALHRAGLHQLVGFLREHGQGELIEQASAEPIIHNLLLLYDLIPSDDFAQVELALQSVRPYINSHGGEVEVLDVVEGIVHLRLAGACQGCAGSAMTLKRGIEGALREGYAGFKQIEVHEPETVAPQHPAPQCEIIPLTAVGQAPPPAPPALRRPVFKAIAALEEVPVGTMKAFDVDGERILLANVAGEIYAVRNTCPGISPAPLDLGSFSPPIVVCPWHNEAYDVRTGKRVDGTPGQHLAVLPIAIVDGSIRLAVNTVPDHALAARQ